MKLVELAKRATKILQETGEKGINNIELAEKLQVPRRRIYDIIAIFRAVGLVEAKREKGGTRLMWSTISTIESAAAPASDTKSDEKLKAAKTKLEKENDELKEKIKRLREDSSKSEPKKISEKKLFNSTKVAIRAAKSLKITEVISSGIEVIIKASGKGIIVEPGSEDTK
ncbi:MAG: hypothetical protein HWN66_07410 [Candidatus Helarchaeota archaeon]|nr:hypothetical protein [Candidatus Helarchaeota archaeon]